MNLITLRNRQLKTVISTLGAELMSIRDTNDVERLWQGNAQWWAGRAPILFPMAGGLRDDRYLLEGKSYPMPKHGYVRRMEWMLEDATDTRAIFLIQEKDAGFPFDYDLRAVFELEKNALKVTYRICNRGRRGFAFGLGSHEGYATPEGIESYKLVFEKNERLENYRLHGNLIARQPVVLAENTNELPLRYSYFSKDALVFPTLKSRTVTLVHCRRGPVIRVSYPEHNVLMLWTRPGAGFICIEPWVNAPDFEDADGDILHKPGIIYLSPGQTAERMHIISIL